MSRRRRLRVPRGPAGVARGGGPSLVRILPPPRLPPGRSRTGDRLAAAVEWEARRRRRRPRSGKPSFPWTAAGPTRCGSPRTSTSRSAASPSGCRRSPPGTPGCSCASATSAGRSRWRRRSGFAIVADRAGVRWAARISLATALSQGRAGAAWRLRRRVLGRGPRDGRGLREVVAEEADLAGPRSIGRPACPGSPCSGPRRRTQRRPPARPTSGVRCGRRFPAVPRPVPASSPGPVAGPPADPPFQRIDRDLRSRVFSSTPVSAASRETWRQWKGSGSLRTRAGQDRGLAMASKSVRPSLGCCSSFSLSSRCGPGLRGPAAAAGRRSGRRLSRSPCGLPVSVTAGAGRPVPHPPQPAPALPPGGLSPSGEVCRRSKWRSCPPTGELELTLPAAFQDSVTVASGVAPNIEAPPACRHRGDRPQEDLEQRRPQRLADALRGGRRAPRGRTRRSTGVPMIRGLARRPHADPARRRARHRRAAGRALRQLSSTPSRSARSRSRAVPAPWPTARTPSAASSTPARASPSRAAPRLRFAARPGRSARATRSRPALEVSGRRAGRRPARPVQLAPAPDDQEAGGGERIPDSAYEDRGGALRYTGVHPARPPAGRVLRWPTRCDVGKPSSDVETVATIYPKETSRRFDLDLDAGPAGRLGEPGAGALLRPLPPGHRPRPRCHPHRLRARSRAPTWTPTTAPCAPWPPAPLLGGRLLAGLRWSPASASRRSPAATTRDARATGSRSRRRCRSTDARQVDGGLFVTFDRPLASRALLSAGLRGDRVETAERGRLLRRPLDLARRAVRLRGPHRGTVP